MTDYCVKGHLVRYESTKPTKCPTCSGPMEAKASIQPTPVVAQRPAPPFHYAPPSNPDLFDSDFSFDESSLRVEGLARKLPTIGELGADGITTERIERDTATGLRGKQENFSVRDAVQQMVAERGNEVAKASTTPRRTRRKKGAS